LCVCVCARVRACEFVCVRSRECVNVCVYACVVCVCVCARVRACVRGWVVVVFSATYQQHTHRCIEMRSIRKAKFSRTIHK